ncbi:hypothetical protein D9619_003517 [Psilocybe cf. subviscida]|uniref:Uncharacterized protein n=1 Tax=Psilocybe cf. subviscida TaxID=2480587 RepID=A0A8H5AXE4_9AGAR|nr:hypothetical protein D9619_003517 [Psilocybe cf. subviscida]
MTRANAFAINDSNSVSISVTDIRFDSLKFEISKLIAGAKKQREAESPCLSFDFAFHEVKSSPTHEEETALDKAYNELFTALCAASSWNNLQALDISKLRAKQISTETLANTFGTLPLLKTLVIGKYTARPSMETLALGLDTEAGKSSDKMRFLGVKVLKLFGASFGFCYRRDREDIDLDFDKMQACLIARKERGAKIKLLQMKACERLYDDQVEGMMDTKEFSKTKIIWDYAEIGFGHYGFDSDDDGQYCQGCYKCE